MKILSLLLLTSLLALNSFAFDVNITEREGNSQHVDLVSTANGADTVTSGPIWVGRLGNNYSLQLVTTQPNDSTDVDSIKILGRNDRSGRDSTDFTESLINTAGTDVSFIDSIAATTSATTSKIVGFALPEVEEIRIRAYFGTKSGNTCSLKTVLRIVP